ncbi:MAG: hypothetical protein ICV63_17540 [Coleofasciculus sp. Co-bin14]|nr:hypothetical protein [Coleofasciculus sp. Co-bin14]
MLRRLERSPTQYSGSQLHTPHLEGHDNIMPLRSPALPYSIQLRTAIFTSLSKPNLLRRNTRLARIFYKVELNQHHDRNE